MNNFKCFALAAGMVLHSLGHAAPVGGQVSTGAASISQSGVTTNISQQSQNVAINWQSFGIASGESVHFIQPNSSSIALNRVLGSDPSQILGSLSANGQVFILNPNGVLFGSGAQVNVGALVATTLGLSDADFAANKYTFTKGSVTGSITNQGSLNASTGGYVVLLGSQVSNQGTISATLGNVLLAAGDRIALTINNGSLIGYSVDQGTLNALVENHGLIQANGGQIVLMAKAADQVTTAVVNTTGIIEARTIQNRNGSIILESDGQGAHIDISGTLDTSDPNGGSGGTINIQSGGNVNLGSSGGGGGGGICLSSSGSGNSCGNNIVSSGGGVISGGGGTITLNGPVTLLSNSTAIALGGPTLVAAYTGTQQGLSSLGKNQTSLSFGAVLDTVNFLVDPATRSNFTIANGGVNTPTVQ